MGSRSGNSATNAGQPSITMKTSPNGSDGGGVVRIFTHLPVSRHRPHAQLLEQGFPLAQNGFHLGDDAVDPVGF